MSDTITIRCAELDDARLLASLLAEAFDDDPVSGWLFPDARDRVRRHSGFFRVFVEHAIRHGVVHVAGDFDAVALWLYVNPDMPDPAPDEGLLRYACGPNYHRFVTLDGVLHETHPGGQPHAYLPFIGVLPGRQGEGLGSALLAYRLADVGALGLPAYLEASTERSARLYERVGFRRLPLRPVLPNGPRLYPMWRPAGRADGRAAGRAAGSAAEGG